MKSKKTAVLLAAMVAAGIAGCARGENQTQGEAQQQATAEAVKIPENTEKKYMDSKEDVLLSLQADDAAMFMVAPVLVKTDEGSVTGAAIKGINKK